MDYIPVIRDSVETAVSMKLFKTKQEAAFAHIYKSTLVRLPIGLFQNVDNFDPVRLQTSAVKAYPLTNRPRGDNDIKSVKYLQKKIQQHEELEPIWLYRAKNKGPRYCLLDGAHRIVASYIEGVKYVDAYVIDAS
jgi:hypothetical protein